MDNNNLNVLVTYATWTGATREVANFIAETMRKSSLNIDVLPVKNISSIDGYDCLVFGTSIHAGQPVKGLVNFLRKYSNEVQERPHAFFVVCANMNENTNENRTETEDWLMKALDNIGPFHPISIGYFAGAILTESEEYAQQNIFLKKVIQGMKEKYLGDFGKTDFRDWEAISQWATELIKLINKKA